MDGPVKYIILPTRIKSIFKIQYIQTIKSILVCFVFVLLCSSVCYLIHIPMVIYKTIGNASEGLLRGRFRLKVIYIGASVVCHIRSSLISKVNKTFRGSRPWAHCGRGYDTRPVRSIMSAHQLKYSVIQCVAHQCVNNMQIKYDIAGAMNCISLLFGIM